VKAPHGGLALARTVVISNKVAVRCKPREKAFRAATVQTARIRRSARKKAVVVLAFKSTL
jgi:hypothetical protein